MKKTYCIKSLYLIILLILSCSHLLAYNGESGKNKSPYFVVLSDGETALLPLKSTDVTVNISGVIADVNVKQTYINNGKSTIEAVYVFPASTRSAVYSMIMKVDDRVIKAEIREKGKARQMYENAKRVGKTASLLEEDKPNVFKMNVANITPGARVEVSLSYVETIIAIDKTYEFVYPTVVGPRYVSNKKLDDETEDTTHNTYLKSGVEPVTKLNIHGHISTGIPIQQISCATHQHEISYLSKNSAEFDLKEEYGGNRDFVLRYNLAGKEIESGILLYNDTNGENYFLAMVEPPKSVHKDKTLAREYVFIVDVSGSMFGFPLDISRNIMEHVLGDLSKDDLFNIVFFAGGSEVFAQESVPATPENVSAAMNYMNSISGSGGTELLLALQKAMNMNANDGYSRSFVILTDGYVDVEKETFDFIRENLGKANFFSFGIGSSVNRYIIEGMARVGLGESFVAENQNRGSMVADKFVNYIKNPVLTDIQYEFKGIEVYDVLPIQVPDLFADRPIVVTGKYRGESKGELIVKGINGSGLFSGELKIDARDAKIEKGLKYLWAREKISLLSDYNKVGHDTALINEITSLSLKYNLLTQYTSFIAIDSIVSNPNGYQKQVLQPSPMPKGVSNYAIGETLNIVDDDVELYEEVEIELMEYEAEECEDVPCFFILEEMPEFPGGDEALKKFIAENIKYPPEAAESCISGRVYVSFVIDTEGNVCEVKVVRGVYPALDSEAIRVVKSMPQWKPGKQRGKAVRCAYTIPVSFVLK